MEDSLELADVIRQMRSELALAMWEGEGKDLRFRLGPVEVDLEIAISRSTKPGVKARLVVVDVEASREVGLVATHRVKVVLEPRLRDDPDRQPWVSGRELDGEE